MKTDSEKEKKLSFALNRLKSLNLQNPTLKSNLENLNIQKTRPDDFFQELQHISSVLDNNELYNESPIRLERGLETMLVIAAAHLSSKNNCPVKIDYAKGFNIDSLSF